jgi:hypothetical protein
MTTTWKSNQTPSSDKKTGNTSNNRTATGTTPTSSPLTSWSRQQKIAMIASFAFLGLLIFVSAASRRTAKPALVGVSGQDSTLPNQPAPMIDATAPANLAEATPAAPAKKVAKKRPANVSYSDPNSGVSFLYPRKFSLSSGDKAQPQFAGVDVPMNYVEPGGMTVATVALPDSSFPGTDFASAFFNVNVNHSVSEEQCRHFAFVDTNNADGEPVDAEKIDVGVTEMEMTSTVEASAKTQAETQYYHNYENGACYEYVLGMSTKGFGSKGKAEHVDRDAVFAKLEKILATIKVKPEAEHTEEPETTGAATGRE